MHSMAIDETCGAHGVRDYHALLSLERSPRQSAFGKELFPTIHEKAAVYARDIIACHPFIDGNKRTAMIAAGVFLEHNGYFVMAEKGEIEEFALRLVKDRLDIAAIAAWLKQHSKRLKK